MVVNFFGSWCVGCIEEHDELVRFDTEGVLGSGGSECSTRLVGVTFSDTAEKVEAFFEARGGDWPVLVGETNSMVVDFGVTAAPETAVVAPDGMVVAKFTGPLTYERLAEVIRC